MWIWSRYVFYLVGGLCLERYLVLYVKNLVWIFHIILFIKSSTLSSGIQRIKQELEICYILWVNSDNSERISALKARKLDAAITQSVN